jgi:hypothetical protein
MGGGSSKPTHSTAHLSDTYSGAYSIYRAHKTVRDIELVRRWPP